MIYATTPNRTRALGAFESTIQNLCERARLTQSDWNAYPAFEAATTKTDAVMAAALWELAQDDDLPVKAAVAIAIKAVAEDIADFHESTGWSVDFD